MKALAEVPGIGFQEITPRSRTTYKDFTIVVDPEAYGLSRDRLVEALSAEGVPTRKYFSPPCHQHKAFREYAGRPLPRTETLAARCLSLPLLDMETVDPLVSTLAKIQEHHNELSKS